MANPEQPLIELKTLTKYFDLSNSSTPVLNGINLDIYANDFVAITGSSGSGKSTLLSIIGLLDTHSQGEYLLCGTEVSNLSRYQMSQLRNRSIGWIFQNFNLVQDMTVLENVMLPLTYQPQFEKNNAKQAVLEALKQVGMADKINQYPSNLSGGQQQRVAIARAIVTQPDLILADEPTGNLDSENSTLIFELLLSLHQKGRTIIMVTHDDEQALKCPSQVILKDGCVISSNHKVHRVAHAV